MSQIGGLRTTHSLGPVWFDGSIVRSFVRPAKRGLKFLFLPTKSIVVAPLTGESGRASAQKSPSYYSQPPPPPPPKCPRPSVRPSAQPFSTFSSFPASRNPIYPRRSIVISATASHIVLSPAGEAYSINRRLDGQNNRDQIYWRCDANGN